MDNIRFVLIIALAIISLMLYQAWEIDYGPKPDTPVVEEIAQNTQEDLPQAGSVAVDDPPELTTAQSQTPEKKSAAVVEEVSTPVIKVSTDVFNLEIDTKGGNLANLDLVQYPEQKVNTYVEKFRNFIGLPAEEFNVNPIRLFNSEKEKLFLAQSGLISDGKSTQLANHHSMFSAESESFTMAENKNTLEVPLYWTNGNGIEVIKTYIFTRGSYEVVMEQKVINQSDSDWSGRQYTQLLRIPYSDEKGNTFIRTYAGGVVYTEEEKYQKVEYSDMADENLNVKSKGGWSAMVQHYFASAWVPPAEEINYYYTKELKDWRYVIGSYSTQTSVPAYSDHVFASRLYAGPKVQPIMEAVSPGLELTVDYGWLTVIGKPIYWLLNKINESVDNWGLSILGVTLCIKLLFFKLTEISYKSMAKMRKIQPKLADLKERFGEDRQRFNAEMMALYKKEKVNPMGGCFPMLVQIPVFISLYWVLIETVELRLAPFALWIQDLSVKDPFFILPLIMGLTMKIQQGLNPAPVDPIQAKVMKMFPVIFTVFFLFFPAGLVLYWVMNNTLSIIQQWVITRNIEKQG